MSVMKLIKAIYYFIGIFFLFPLSCLIPKKRNLVSIIGKEEGKFVDNTKYLFIYLNEIRESKKFEFYYITGNKEIYYTLKEFKFPVLYYPSFMSVLTILRSNFIIIDELSAFKISKYYLGFKSKKIQLWHGSNLKKIEIEKFEEDISDFNLFKKLAVIIFNKIVGSYPKYEIVTSSSTFFTKIFKKSFKSNHFIETGYPRNDIFFKGKDLSNYELIGTDKSVIHQILEEKRKGKRIILYAPTFRDSEGDVIADNILDLHRLSNFAYNNNYFLVFKFHRSGLSYDLSEFKNIIEYDNTLDAQPILKIIDLLITDYSSIFFDFLLLNKPIIFFPYDYNKYTSKDRQLVCDYDYMTPGPKCYNQNDLELNILEIFQYDKFVEERNKILRITFDYIDGNSSERIWNYLHKYINIK